MASRTYSCKKPTAPPVPGIISKPVSPKQDPRTFDIGPRTTLVLAGSDLQPSADFLNAYLYNNYGFRLPVTPVAEDPGRFGTAIKIYP